MTSILASIRGYFGFYSHPDNWHKHVGLNRLICILGRHDYERSNIEADGSTVKFHHRCFYCEAEKTYRYHRWQLAEPAPCEELPQETELHPCWPDREQDEAMLAEFVRLRGLAECDASKKMLDCCIEAYSASLYD